MTSLPWSGINGDRVVERAMRLDIGDARARGLCETLQRADW